MAESALNDAVFRLPDQFLTDDYLLFDKENAPFNCKSSGAGGFEMTTTVAAAAESLKPSSVTVSFPMEFPYEFDSALSSPVDSVVCSTEMETETENSLSSDEEDFLAGLTRRLTHSTQKLAVPGVTHDKLEKSWVMSGSPESTLSGIGSWSMSSSDSPNGSSLVSSPPATPFSCQNDTWDLISAAAGQVARLKMSNEALNKHNNINNNINSHGRGLIAPPKTTNSVHVMKNPDFVGFYSTTATTNTTQSVNQYQQYVKQEQILRGRQQLVRSTWAAAHEPPYQQQKQHPVQQIQNKQLVRNAVGYHENTRCGGGGVSGGRPLGLSQSAWPPLQAHPVQQQHTSNTSSNMRAVFLGGSGGGVKRECAGTGVFLPRRYGNNNNNNNINNFNNNPHDSRKKLGCSTVLLPAKVVQALNLNFEDIHSHVQTQQRFNGTGIGPNYDALIARRNALLMLQKRSLRGDPAINHHHHEQLHLPQDWTY